MSTINAFEFLAAGVRVRMDIGDGGMLVCVVESVEPTTGIVELRLEGDQRSADATSFVDWRIYMLTSLHSREGTEASEVIVPTEFRRLTRDPWRVWLEVLEGTMVRQLRNSYRAPRLGLQARVRVAGTASIATGEVLNLGEGGLALITPTTPPPHASELRIELIVPEGESLPLLGVLVGSTQGFAGSADWQWRVQFRELLEPVRSALLLQVHREER